MTIKLVQWNPFGVTQRSRLRLAKHESLHESFAEYVPADAIGINVAMVVCVEASHNSFETV